MSATWTQESPPSWDATKGNILDAIPQGSVSLDDFEDGQLLPGDWFRVEQDGKVIGYGWLDTSWGDAEINLMVDPAHQRAGTGTFILDHLADEAGRRGINYLFNSIPPGHPDPHGLGKWLAARGFAPSEDGKLLRRAVRA